MKNIALVLGLMHVFAFTALAEQPCSEATKEVKMESKQATASTFANMFNRQGSLRFESTEMFEDAKKVYLSHEKPANFCPPKCQVAKTPEMIFVSIPNKYRSDYSDAAKCDQYYKNTKSSPLEFKQTLPPTVEKLADWIGDFSQGQGEEGNKLYQECDGSCSPRFSYNIFLRHHMLDVHAEVVCGPARDKDDNMYTISYSFVWSCEDIN